jgi:hypothetical protein
LRSKSRDFFLHIPRFTLRTFSVFHWSFSAFHSIQAIFLHIPPCGRKIFLRIRLQFAQHTIILSRYSTPVVAAICSLPASSSQHSTEEPFQNEEQPKESPGAPCQLVGGLIVESSQSVAQGCSVPGDRLVLGKGVLIGVFLRIPLGTIVKKPAINAAAKSSLDAGHRSNISPHSTCGRTLDRSSFVFHSSLHNVPSFFSRNSTPGCSGTALCPRLLVSIQR